MTSPATKAMIESYALMVLVMGTFFVYFCGMVWAFCNPKLSGAEEECAAEKQAAEYLGGDAHLAPAPPYAADWLTHTTYVNFSDDTDSLLTGCAAFRREDRGVNNQMCHHIIKE